MLSFLENCFLGLFDELSKSTAVIAADLDSDGRLFQLDLEFLNFPLLTSAGLSNCAGGVFFLKGLSLDKTEFKTVFGSP